MPTSRTSPLLAICVVVLALMPLDGHANIVVTLAGTVNEINAGSVVVTNAANATPEVTATNTNAGTPTITTGIATLTDDALVLDMVGSGNAGFFTPGAGQTEHFDTAAASATGAMSSKAVATAGATTMSQTHNTVSNRTAHAVLAITSENGTSAPVVAATASANNTISAGINFVQAIPGGGGTKRVFVGIAIEDPTCTGNQNVTSVTFAGWAAPWHSLISLIFIVYLIGLRGFLNTDHVRAYFGVGPFVSKPKT